MNHRKDNDVVLVTGSSSGIGRLTVKTLARAGFAVYASMRDPVGRNQSTAAELTALADDEGLDLAIVDIDVTDDASVDAGVRAVEAARGRIDVLINNAGVMNVGITEAYTIEQIRTQMDVNFLGAARLNRAVLPGMRVRGRGLLVHVSSLAGRLVFPFFGIYCASKFALEAMAEAYRYELSAAGIDSIVVEPGPFGTELIARSPKPADTERVAAYGELAATPEATLTEFDNMLSASDAPDPQMVADDILALIRQPASERPLRTVSGIDFGLRAMNQGVLPVQRALLEGLGFTHLDPGAKAA